MLVTIRLSAPGWESSESATGQFMKCGKILHDTTTPLSEAKDSQTFCRQLKELNGFYAVVRQTPGLLMAAVDHIRSIPLFYGQKEGRLFLADDAEWVRQQVGDHKMDPRARDEFQLAGYVTGQDTLFPNVKQLQAGECLVVRENADNLQVTTQRYYRFLHTEPTEYDEKSLRDELDQKALGSIQRLVDYAGGRQIVVPLSGGYDSRLIVTLLKRLGYENVLTFTYGVKGNKESQYSKRVADALGLKWQFVEYTSDLWRTAWQTDERWQYQEWASGWSSIAHVQDWLAVKLLKAKAVVDADCIFVPGHSGDFVAGSHIPLVAFQKSKFSISEVGESVFSNHYKLAPISITNSSREHWLNRINMLLEREKISRPFEYADAYEKWDWQERQAKFICNSVRVYEFFGYDWWMPLWDKEFVRFWQEVPLELREGREWYVDYVKEQFSQNASQLREGSLKNAGETYVFSAGLKQIDVLRNSKIVMFIVKNVLRRKSGLAFDGRYPKYVTAKLEKQGYSSNGVFALFFLKKLQKIIK